MLQPAIRQMTASPPIPAATSTSFPESSLQPSPKLQPRRKLPLLLTTLPLTGPALPTSTWLQSPSLHTRTTLAQYSHAPRFSSHNQLPAPLQPPSTIYEWDFTNQLKPSLLRPVSVTKPPPGPFPPSPENPGPCHRLPTNPTSFEAQALLLYLRHSRITPFSNLLLSHFPQPGFLLIP
ncbi:hypothetical protein B0T10DRAFT_22948 [Thelonectria olida]|uniref:Uncharacterized protein n=1 Tax=Thelonectria olida TaxID=1576542 RepID=A0A9P8WIV7_9HYPO|nr:hypothetical protein B0T10DRAFT_22948 [Thelonectria olida]